MRRSNSSRRPVSEDARVFDITRGRSSEWDERIEELVDLCDEMHAVIDDGISSVRSNDSIGTSSRMLALSDDIVRLRDEMMGMHSSKSGARWSERR